MALFSFPTLQELRSVQVALTWLLKEQENDDNDILASARLKGIVLFEDDTQWKVDGALLESLTQESLGRLPDDPDRVGEILHGIGEMAARSHAHGLPGLLVDYLKERQPQISLQRILDAAILSDSAIHPKQLGFEELSLAQWITRSALNWGTFEAAMYRIGHPDRVYGHFGLDFVASIILCTNPSVIDDWITTHPELPVNPQHPDHRAVAVFGSTALKMVFPYDTQSNVTPLLESRNIAIKCLGAASIVCPLERQSPLNMRDCHRTLVTAGFAAADATWLTGMRIKQAVHSRYRLEHGREDTSKQLLYVERNPDKAAGGVRNAQAEIRWLRDNLDRTEKAYSKLLPELEAMLDDMAADWPTEGLSDEQMISLDPIFVDTAEIRYRLAAKLPHPDNRNWLLKQNITQLEDFIGLKKKPADIPKEYFKPDERRFYAIVEWAAKSLILLYEQDKRGVGKRTSDLVSGVAKASFDLIVQPFMSGRQPEKWQSVMTRSACAALFAFAVVACTPPERKSEVAILNELTLEHSFKLLTSGNLPWNAAEFLHTLTIQAVEHMGISATPSDIQEKWVLTKNLPDFARAFALWSSPVLVEEHTTLGHTLFQRVGVLPLSWREYDHQMRRMLTLLDAAIASSALAEKRELILSICKLWRSTYHGWLPIDNRWEGIAMTLATAVETEGAERAQIVADKMFANSYCRRLIGE